MSHTHPDAVMKNTYPMNAAVVGCGERCRRFLEHLQDVRLQWLPIKIIGLACPDPLGAVAQFDEIIDRVLV